MSNSTKRSLEEGDSPSTSRHTLSIKDDEEEYVYDEEKAVAILLAEVTDTLKVPENVIKKARLEQRMYHAKLQWESLKVQLNLGYPIPKVSPRPTIYLLPPSLTKSILHQTYKALQLYRIHNRSEGTPVPLISRGLIENCVTNIASYFDGRIECRVEASPGVFAEYEFWVLRGCFFFVVEAEKDESSASWVPNDLAQLLVKMYSAALMRNKLYGVEVLNMPVYGLLTSLDMNVFYVYDPAKKQFQEHGRYACSSLRDLLIGSLVPVCNHIFTILVNSYENALKAASKMKPDEKNYQLDDQADLQNATRSLGEAIAKFEEAVVEMACSGNDQLAGGDAGKEGLNLLNESVNHVRGWHSASAVFSVTTALHPPHSQEEITAMIDEGMKRFYSSLKECDFWKQSGKAQSKAQSKEDAEASG